MQRIRWIAVFAAVVLAGCGFGMDDDGHYARGMGDESTGAGGRGGTGPTGGTGPISGGGGAGPGTADPDWQSGENYTSYGENQFTDPAEDNLCTFGIDVDTASYTIMRR